MEMLAKNSNKTEVEYTMRKQGQFFLVLYKGDDKNKKKTKGVEREQKSSGKRSEKRTTTVGSFCA